MATATTAVVKVDCAFGLVVRLAVKVVRGGGGAGLRRLVMR